MTTSAALYADFQAANPENAMNDSLIYWRREDDITGYLEDVFRALEVVPGITLLSVDVEKDESKFPPHLKYSDIEVSRMDLAVIRVSLELGKEKEEIELNLQVPKLIDEFFYELNGSKYYPILQLVDRGTYVTKKTYTLKTLLMPLVMRTDVHVTVTDLTDDAEYDGVMLYVLDLFKSKINVLTYFFAGAGMDATLEYFGVQDRLFVASGEDVPGLDPEAYVALPVKDSELVVVADRDWMTGDQAAHAVSLAATLADALEGVPPQQAAEDGLEIRDGETEEAHEARQVRVREFWLKRLGRYFTKNPASHVEKAEKILVSLERILDGRTKKNLAHVDEADKEDVYAILRWMMREYEALSRVDNMDVRTKRIRLSEYLIHPLLLRFSESTYRMLNSPTITMGKLKSIFRNVGPGFVIRKLVTNDLLRYSGLVNQHDLFSTALRFTTRGPQSMGERGKGDLMLRFRGHHESYVGRIGLSAASASDPGASGTLVPWAATTGPFFD